MDSACFTITGDCSLVTSRKSVEIAPAARRLDAAAKNLTGTIRAQFGTPSDLPGQARRRK